MSRDKWVTRMDKLTPKKDELTINLEDLREAGTTGEEVLKMAEEAAKARGVKPHSDFASNLDELTNALKRSAATYDERKAVDAKKVELENTIRNILDQFPKPDEEMLSLIQRAQEALNKVSGRKGNGDTQNIAKKAEFLAKLRLLKGGDLDWKEVAVLVLNKQAKDALKETRAKEGAIVVRDYFKEGKEAEERYFVEANGDVIDNYIAAELRQLYEDRRKAGREKAEIIRRDVEKREKAMRETAKLTHAEFRDRKPGTILIVVYDKDERRKIGAFTMTSNGETVKVAETSSDVVWDLLNKYDLFRKFPFGEEPPSLLESLFKKDEKRLNNAKAEHEERKAAAKEHEGALKAKATISLAEANASKEGKFYVSIHFKPNQQSPFLFGGFLVEVRSGKARVIETTGAGGNLILKEMSPERMSRFLSWDGFTQVDVPVIRSSLRHLANIEGVLLPGMKPRTEVKTENASQDEQSSETAAE